jgi:hypothetical protein
MDIASAFLLIGAFRLLKSGYKAFKQDIDERKHTQPPQKDALITIPVPCPPLCEWDLRLLPPPKYFPWHQVISNPVIDKKYMKLLPFLYEDAVDLSELAIPDGEMARRIAIHYHTCLTADLICVLYKSPYIKNDINGRIEGILTICPNCRRQVGFNGTIMN